MEYELYIDVLVISNFCMDVLSLFLASVFLRRKRHLKSLILPAFLGTIASTALFLFLADYIVYVLLVHLLVNPLMVWLAFRSKDIRRFLKEWAVCYMIVLLTGGIMQWLYITIFQGHHMGICIILTMAVGFTIAGIWNKQMIIGKSVYQVKLKIGTETIELKAYYDTGNLLMDPYFEQPVHIAAKGRLQEALSRNSVQGRLVSFSSLGKKNGWIDAYTIDEMLVYQDRNVVQVRPAVIGVTDDQLFKHGDYQMILNSHLCLK